MIKNILYISMLSLLMISCEQKESFLYESKDGLYFTLPGTTLNPWDTENPEEEFTKEIDFAFRETGERDYDTGCKLYYGDSLRADTLRLVVAVSGTVRDKAREYNLKAASISDTTEFAEVQFANPYRIEAGQTKDTAIVIIPRTYRRGFSGAEITIDIENSPEFGSTITNWNKYHLHISDRYTEPNGWDVQEYGDFSEEKYAFWVSVLHIVYEDRYQLWTVPNIRQALNDALREYNTANPDNKKDFDFPGYTE